MSDRSMLLGLAAAGLFVTAAAVRVADAGPPSTGVRPVAVRLAGEKDDDEKDGAEKKTEEKVDVAQLPAAVVETVMKECPNGKITEAEKVTTKGKTYYSMDVTVGDAKYAVKTTLDGKFKSKAVDDDDDDEKGDHEDKK